jgi:hypothetical protein
MADRRIDCGAVRPTTECAVECVSEFVCDRHCAERAQIDAAFFDDEQSRRRRRPRIDVDAEAPKGRREIAIAFAFPEDLHANSSGQRKA